MKKQFLNLVLSKPTKIANFNMAQRITFPHLENLIQKIMKMRNQHKEIDLIADFDHTLTQHRLGNQKCDSLFGMWVKNNNLPQQFRHQLLQNYKTYGPYQTDPTMEFSQKLKYVDKLYQVQRDLFHKHQITNEHAMQVLDNSQLVFRAHMLELLEKLQKIELQLHIVSGGISDLIYSSLVSIAGKQLIDKVVHIHSNAWQVYKKQKSVQFLKFTPQIVHSYNKHLVMRQISSKKKNCLLMGDLKSDIYMAYGAGYNQILSIFYGKEGQFDQRALAELKFDIIVQGDSSHKIVIQILKIISGNRNIDWPYLYRIEPILTQLII